MWSPPRPTYRRSPETSKASAVTRSIAPPSPRARRRARDVDQTHVTSHESDRKRCAVGREGEARHGLFELDRLAEARSCHVPQIEQIAHARRATRRPERTRAPSPWNRAPSPRNRGCRRSPVSADPRTRRHRRQVARARSHGGRRPGAARDRRRCPADPASLPAQPFRRLRNNGAWCCRGRRRRDRPRHRPDSRRRPGRHRGVRYRRSRLRASRAQVPLVDEPVIRTSRPAWSPR